MSSASLNESLSHLRANPQMRAWAEEVARAGDGVDDRAGRRIDGVDGRVGVVDDEEADVAGPLRELVQLGELGAEVQKTE